MEKHDVANLHDLFLSKIRGRPILVLGFSKSVGKVDKPVVFLPRHHNQGGVSLRSDRSMFGSLTFDVQIRTYY